MSGRQPQYPIAVVTRMSGLRADLIRAWERRHGAIEPARTPGLRRLYSDADVQRLIRLRQLLQNGWRIGQVAKLPDDELTRLLEHGAATGADRNPDLSPTQLRLEECLAAVADLDGAELRRLLERASASWSRIHLLDELVAPLVDRIGDGCRQGALRPANEHLATVVLRSFLDGLHGAHAPDAATPRLLIATPMFQHHDLGAMLVTATARSEGWQGEFLGANLPSEEIAAAAAARGSRAIALSIVHPPGDARLEQDLRKLGRLVDGSVELLVGGGAAASYDRVLQECRAIRLESLAELRSALAALAGG